MRQYWFTNDMLGPCCLCSLINPMGLDFVEAAIYLATSGAYAGEYVASCATDNCGYLGEFRCLPTMGLLVLDPVVLNTSVSTNGEISHLTWPIYQGVPSEGWDEPHALVKKLTYRLYPAFGERVPPLVTHTSEGFPSQTAPQDLVRHWPLKRTYAMMGEFRFCLTCCLWVLTTSTRRHCRWCGRATTVQAHHGKWEAQLLANLGSSSGITSWDFQKLFVKCDLCGCVMMHHVFAAHDCNVIDLSGDTDLE